MAFAKANFSPLGSNARRGVAPQHFTYRTADTLATCDTSGYFNDITTMLEVGDTIHITVVDSVATPTAVTEIGRLVVVSNTGGVVDTYDAISSGGKIYLTVTMADVSTASSVWVTAPVACKFTKLYSVINGAIATADAAITTEIGGTAVTGGTITIANSGSAAGDVDSGTPTAANTLTAGQALEIITDGASTNTVIATFTVELTAIGDSD
jgi:hypothetical protein